VRNWDNIATTGEKAVQKPAEMEFDRFWIPGTTGGRQMKTKGSELPLLR